MIEHPGVSFIFSGLTLIAFLLGLWIFKKFRQFPLLHPLVISSAAIAGLLIYLDIDYSKYQAATGIFYHLLGPATVALAIPMYREIRRIRQVSRSLLITLFAGAFIAPVSAIVVAYLLGADNGVTSALLTKSVTTPIALEAAKISTHAHPGLVAGIVIFTGVITAILATPLFRMFKVTDPRVQGIALGINGHAAGTTRGFEISETCGAFSSLALGLTGLITIFLLPLIIALIGV